MDTKKLIGLSLEEAKQMVADSGLKCCVVIPGVSNVLTCDFRLDRVSLEVENGRVTYAHVG